MKKSKLFIFIFFLALGIGTAQNCEDGMQNGDETGVDCGGLYCPKCVNLNTPLIQNIMTHTKLGKPFIGGIGDTRIAIDSSGKRAIVSIEGKQGSINSVYTMNTDGSHFSEIFSYIGHELHSNDKPAFVDISRDGTKVLWTSGIGGIFVSDFNGENRFLAAEKITNQNDITTELDLITWTTSPKFTSDGSKIIFTHAENGSKNRGIWEVGINQSKAINQLINIEDLGEEFDETIWNTGGHLDFYQLQITENNDIQFLSNLLNENAVTDVFLLKDGALNLTLDNQITNYATDKKQSSISKDGKFTFWIDGFPTSSTFYKLNHETKLITSHDMSQEPTGLWKIRSIESNYDGSLVFVSGYTKNGAGNEYVIVKLNGDQYYPIHHSHNFSPVETYHVKRGMVLSEFNEKLVYVAQKLWNGSDPNEVWCTDITPNTLDSKYGQLESFSLNPNEIIPGRISKSEFKVSVFAGDTETIDKVLFSTFADTIPRKGNFLDPDGGTQLYNDGVSNGDQAIDMIFTNNEIIFSNQGYAQNIELPHKFSVRFSLISDNYITSYDVYPVFLVDEISSSLSEEVNQDNDIRIYPNTLSNNNPILSVESNIPINTGSWKIMDAQGHVVMRSNNYSNLFQINTSDLTAATYFLLINTGKRNYTKQFIKL